MGYVETKHYGIVRRHVAKVWCGVMPRKGSGQHMRTCQDCRRVKARYWWAVKHGD